MIFTSSGFHLVIVPVLSMTTTFTLWSVSSVEASLMRIHSPAHFPTPTMIAVGVASPRAHGQAITRIPTNDVSPSERAFENPRV